MRLKLWIGLFLILLGLELSAQQTIISGTVVKIIDGDTFDLLVEKSKLIRVRLADIDAPEKSQDFGLASKKTLNSLIVAKLVDVHFLKYDRNGRMIGSVYVDKLNINLKMVEMGMAWHYLKYSSNSNFAKAEQLARKQNIGIWSQPKAMPPWEYRKIKHAAKAK
jgi:micrococcal nuclease